MPLLDWLLEILLGAALGFLGGMFGIGGGVLAIPTLGLLFGFSQQMAQGTAMVTVVPNVYLALWLYRRRHALSLKLGLLLGAGSVVFTYLAARLALGLDSHLLRRCFAGFVMAMAAYLIFKARAPAPGAGEPAPVLSRRWLPGVGALVGIVSGFFGVGGGLITPPLLTGLFGMRQLAAQGMALALVAPGATIALITYGLGNQVNWTMGVLLAVGGFLAVSPGVALAHRLPERLLKGSFGVFLLLAAGTLYWTSLR
jgi:uncharacterized membrane protein YfcA